MLLVKFHRCVTPEERNAHIKEPNVHPLKCGFNTPSSLDDIRARFEKDTVCKVVVEVSIFGGYDKLLAPDHKEKHLEVCYILLVDAKTRAHFEKLVQPALDALPEGFFTIFDLDVLPFAKPTYAWQIFNVKSTKLLSPLLFPNAEYVVHLDGKFELRVDPRHLIAAANLTDEFPFLVKNHPIAGKNSEREFGDLNRRVRDVVGVTHHLFSAFSLSF
jgi:hypothetical protein